MRLFYISDLYEVELNREWIMMVPEFMALIKRDRGSEGDYRGEKKLKAKKQLAYIYFCLDFTSPLREWDDIPRRQEALRYTGLVPEDIDDKVDDAWAVYEQLLLLAAPSLKTLNAIRKGRANLNKYFEEVDFEKKDKLGKSYYTPKDYMENIARLSTMDRAIKDYEKQVEAELKADTGIRGKGTLGGKEGKRRAEKVWHEGGPPDDDPDSPDLETQEL